jgi:hypothetical protein
VEVDGVLGAPGLAATGLATVPGVVGLTPGLVVPGVPTPGFLAGPVVGEVTPVAGVPGAFLPSGLATFTSVFPSGFLIVLVGEPVTPVPGFLAG